MIIHNFEQNTPEWHEIRKLKLTASKADAIATSGKGLETLCYELVAEYFSTAEKINYTNEDIERGKTLELEASIIYMLNTSRKITSVGFVELNKHVGCSPDGLVEQDGLIEIKSPNDKNYIKFLHNKEIDSKYIWQMQMQMHVTGRDWCDFVVYNPNFNKSIFITRINKNEQQQEKIKQGLERGQKILNNIYNDITKELS